MRVNELSEKLSITPDTVRYYTRIGLLSPRKSLENGYKNYSPDDEKRLVFILKARNLGFSVAEVQEIIAVSETGASPCCKVREMVFKHMEETLVKIEELQRLHNHMKNATERWETMPDSMPDGDSVCDLIEMWDAVDLNHAV